MEQSGTGQSATDTLCEDSELSDLFQVPELEIDEELTAALEPIDD